jgi:hypothetical protein
MRASEIERPTAKRKSAQRLEARVESLRKAVRILAQEVRRLAALKDAGP